ncbi:MAG: DUF882 domain-containing protein [Betaproteobacteria bacterium]|nr:DUF882 domain-containing protein [Betaproteobacteria bacterium]
MASKSLHTEGRAIDVRLPSVALADLRDAALSLRAGGVGYYAREDFRADLDTRARSPLLTRARPARPARPHPGVGCLGRPQRLRERGFAGLIDTLPAAGRGVPGGGA